MTKKAENKPDQIRAFRKAARELGTDESEARFDTALKAIAQHKSKATSDKTKATSNK